MSKIVVGLSGGVDSSVSAYLLKEAGHDVIGVFMKNWEEEDESGYCPSAQDAADAKAVADKIGIPFVAVNFSREYWDRVFAYFLKEYGAGRTPNPDVLCNKEVKFKAFLEYALNTLGADLIATGHYAQKRQNAEGGYELLRGLDANKDQSYFLYLLNQYQLSKSIFPIGHLEKSEVRQIAQKAGLVTHNKKDSTGICFIGEREFKTFLEGYLPAKPGNIVTEKGKVIGRHEGLMYHTIGQRKGLHIGGDKTGSGEAWYVADKDLHNNRLIVAQGKNHPALFKANLICEAPHWSAGRVPEFPLHCTAKTRYHQDDSDINAIVSPLENNQLGVVFETPQRAITPGQSIVFYDKEVCLGGGIII
jgi:tRNA-specific 2-thiouridylase